MDGLRARFQGDWDALNLPAACATGRVALAVSGGPDSCALLVLAAACWPDRVCAATVDHGLRPEAVREAEAVAGLCARLSVPHAILPIALGAGPSIQARARAGRYAALARWARAAGAGVLATAHHADDQAETMVMRLNRGAGVRGLAGMRPLAGVPGDPLLPLARPLLGWRRAELAAVVRQAGIEPADDPSNRDSRFERVRVRQGLDGTGDWLDPAGLATSAGHLADADAALEWMADALMAQHWEAKGSRGEGILSPPPGLPVALALRLLERVLALADSDRGLPRGPELARWHATLVQGGVATLAGLRGEGRGLSWHFQPVAPHRCATD